MSFSWLCRRFAPPSARTWRGVGGEALALMLLIAACAGEERTPLPYYGAPGQPGGVAGASYGGSGQGGTTTGPVGPQPGDVVINEVDPTGEPSDWVELVNRGEADIDVSGWVVAQGYDGETDPTDADRLVLAAGTTLPTGGHLVVYTRAAEGPGPGDFGLSKSKPQRVSLFDADGVWRDDTTTDASTGSPFDDGTSWARQPDASGDFARTAATPGASNEGS